MVKVYDVSTYKVLHTMRYPAPILCLAISVGHRYECFFNGITFLQPDETHIAAGMTDGTLCVRRRQKKTSALDPLATSGGYESLLGAAASRIGQGVVRSKVRSKPVGEIDEFQVESRRTKRLKDYDKFLKSFKYSAALDAVLRKVCCQQCLAKANF
jgi:U3 small nucleolar RNA-associated protein 15